MEYLNGIEAVDAEWNRLDRLLQIQTPQLCKYWGLTFFRFTLMARNENNKKYL